MRFNYRSKKDNEDALWQLEVAKLYIDYAKYCSTLFSSFLAGQVTLLGTVFSELKSREFAVYAILLMVFAVISAYSIAETELRRLRGQEIDRDVPRYVILRKRFPNHTSVQTGKSFLTGVLVVSSISCYLYFLYLGNVVKLPL
ncbi:MULTISPECIES: hypothetical protein [Vibrio]|uniref:hypothetical protein n=1 Tax=Vibrio TaxID=662 RepID=UPI00036BD242|nr:MULTISPECIES: hypothetical protein [Vibrio]EHY9871129.1 hypothetical protein [Vibrio vulnificus]APP09247.1 hypothetical protein BG259_28665 [Vibrio harveyi]EIC2761745.1 hypothetical protein [Vibrio vulnificus]EKO3839367.1 hypothetical protein [Vibrio harveyi]ELU4011495.1 hypothetical protein [Vibrio vulnificus]